MNIHVLAVGGIGMSGIARLLLQLGHTVSGTDISHNYIIDDLAKEGLILESLSEAVKSRRVDAVVTSTAVPYEDPQLEFARSLDIPIYHRAEMLQAIFNSKRVIGITGAHGKTTSTALLSWILHELGYRPSAYIGGILKGIGLNAWIGSGEVAVLELDESDGSFSLFSPEIMFIPYLELEHVDFYGQESSMVEFFRNYMLQRQDTKFLIGLGSKISKEFSQFENIRLVQELRFSPIRYRVNTDFTMDVEYLDREKNEVISGRVPLIGLHNVRNICGVLQICDWLEIDPVQVIRAIEVFPGIARRMDVMSCSPLLIIHDYAHHPTEIGSTISAVRDVIGKRRLVVVFEPHRYSRFSGFWNEFISSLSGSDLLLVTPVYSAGERPIERISSERFCVEFIRHIGKPAYAMIGYDVDEVQAAVQDGDCLLFLGAGKIYSLAKAVTKNMLAYQN